MSEDIVKQGYNKVAEEYSSQRDLFRNEKYLKQLAALLRSGSSVLDIGCGAGVPVDKYLVDKGFKVTGIDISEKQIELAKKNVPAANFHVKDMQQIKECEYQVNAVVSFYAIFHINREYHLKLLKKINTFLKKGGFLLITMGASEWEGSEDFHGAEMWWSHYGAEKNRELVEQAGFNIILDEIDESGEEKHQVIIAERV